MSDKNKIINAVDNFGKSRILVVGDFILDKFVTGSVARISPEAPVPVVKIKEEKYMPGGAGNVVFNILSLGASVFASSIVGEDLSGERLLKILKAKGADVSGILRDFRRPTSIKTRVIAEHQQVVRTDMESTEELDDDLTESLIEALGRKIGECDGVVISDYGKGLITTRLIEYILSECRKDRKLPVVVDPQVGHFFEYKGVTSVTPNVKEASSALGFEITNEKELKRAGRNLLEELKTESVLITRGEEGMSFFGSDGSFSNVASIAREVYDVTGAGDTVAGVFTLGLAAGLDFIDAAAVANCAAAVVVGKLGTATVTPRELKEQFRRKFG